MAKNYIDDDTFLGRWIAGALSKDELKAFEQSETFKQFEIINRESQLLAGPNIDTETALQIVKQKLQTGAKTSKVKQLWYAIAVAAVLILSLGTFLTSNKTYTTAIGEKQTIRLADGSVINLNANSSLSHKRFFWLHNKVVKLTGEAYFKIVKEGPFVVNTSKGAINVLGTEFNIKDRTQFEIKCYEGKIRFTKLDNTDTTKDFTLTKGSQILLDHSMIKEQTFKEDTPDWKTGISKFTDQPLSIVLEELTCLYPITFDINTIDTTRLFSGSFTHNNLENALQTTLIPMGITYQKPEGSPIIILSK
ncbi:FecR family protein [Flavivirga amylovorans]|uniref:FecR family protein n=1 Tax=Flavivirga amylovorans TaxID=870486 RepID=A0ABT8X3R7_9FLAO|nr:FecR family protein [Flavivirga amylovorans]MDO5988536.1 FecR family protein [Flavivirga amylovorans]